MFFLIKGKLMFFFVEDEKSPISTTFSQVCVMKKCFFETVED